MTTKYVFYIVIMFRSSLYKVPNQQSHSTSIPDSPTLELSAISSAISSTCDWISYLFLYSYFRQTMMQFGTIQINILTILWRYMLNFAIMMFLSKEKLFCEILLLKGNSVKCDLQILKDSDNGSNEVDRFDFGILWRIRISRGWKEAAWGEVFILDFIKIDFNFWGENRIRRFQALHNSTSRWLYSADSSKSKLFSEKCWDALDIVFSLIVGHPQNARTTHYTNHII